MDDFSGSVAVPGASSLRVKFDPACQWNAGVTLDLAEDPAFATIITSISSANAQLEDVFTAGDTLHYRFRGRLERAYGYKFEVTVAGAGIVKWTNPLGTGFSPLLARTVALQGASGPCASRLAKTGPVLNGPCFWTLLKHLFILRFCFLFRVISTFIANPGVLAS